MDSWGSAHGPKLASRVFLVTPEQHGLWFKQKALSNPTVKLNLHSVQVWRCQLTRGIYMLRSELQRGDPHPPSIDAGSVIYTEGLVA